MQHLFFKKSPEFDDYLLLSDKQRKYVPDGYRLAVTASGGPNSRM